jgi:PKD repeat protein
VGLQSPVASFNYLPEFPTVHETITFDASSSDDAGYDPGDYIVSYKWDFGDGSREEGKVVTHAYTEPGKYEVCLIVTDSYHLMSRLRKFVSVLSEGQAKKIKLNKPPTANAHGPYYSNINEPIQFYGTGTDPDGDEIIAYAWDFDNNGITDSMLQNPTHSWSSAGTYYPTLKVQDGKTVWSELDQCTVNIGLADQTTDRSQLSDSIINQYKNQFPNDPEKVNEKLMEYTNSEREERLINAILISTKTEEQRNDIQTLIDSNTGDRGALLAAIGAYINVNIEDHQSFWDQVKNKFWSTKIPKGVHEIAEAINIFDDLIKKVSWLKPIAWGGTTISTIEDVQAQHEITQKLDSSSVPTDTANALKVADAIIMMTKPFDKTNYYAPVTDATIGRVVDVAVKITAQRVSVRNTEEFKYIYNDQRILFGEGKPYVDDNGGSAPIYLGSEDDRYYIKLQGKPKTDFIYKLFGLREVGYWREIREVGDNKWELVPIPESSAVKSLSAFNSNDTGIKIYNIFTEDLDGDGYANIINYDTDNDTIPDVILIDKNNDSLIDIWKFKDNESFLIAYDTNNNGIPDVYDLNDDGNINAWDLDEDGNPDQIDLNDDGLIDAFDTDYNGVLDSFVEYNQTLIAWINAPSYGSIFSQNETIVFNGSVYNGTKNGTAPYSFSWVSDIFGFIGTGSLINSSTLPIGGHNITLMVQDSAGLTDRDTIKITVYPPAVHHNTDSEKNFSSIQAAIDDPDTLDGYIITIDPGKYVEFEKISS